MVSTRSEPTTDWGTATDLTESERHEVLASDRRRAVLAVLADRHGPVELACLAAGVAEALDGVTADERTERDLAIELHHVHLPKLSEFGVIDYDPASNWVDPDPPG